ncbi:MAG: alpha/beta fold hydrolase [Chthoniobacterales bacterium]|nr:alpha/beta fold hydrolase [Chthoniobacterales bacterium]
MGNSRLAGWDWSRPAASGRGGDTRITATQRRGYSACARRSLVAAGVVLGTALLSSPAEAAASTAGSYTSGGRKILIDEYPSAKPGTRPAIILLHGSAGLLFPGLDLKKRASALSAQGYAVFVPHFFNRTGQIMVRPSGVHDNLPAWTATVRDAVTYVAAQPNVDANRIALMGHSLGGYLGLAAAAQDGRIDAVVEASGALDKTGVTRMPPTLILHGAKDTTVPVAKAERLEALLLKTGAPYQKHIYPDEKHVLSREAMRDATQRIDRFLAKYFPADSRS